MATYANVPLQLIDIIQGVIFLFFAAEQFLSKYRQKLVVKSAEEEIARKKALQDPCFVHPVLLRVSSAAGPRGYEASHPI